MIVLTTLLVLALASDRGDSHPAPPPPPAPQHAAPPPPPHAAPPPRPPQGFSLPHDVKPVQRVAPPLHPGAPPVVQPATMPHTVARTVQPLPRYQGRQPVNGKRIPNPNNWTQPWQWNNGTAWVAAPYYWGGGFWGPWDLGLLAGTYFVMPDSPGARLLSAYGLTQTQCNQPNLVEIFGPDGSEICAFPNAIVGPGQYEIDPSTLTLLSVAPQ